MGKPKQTKIVPPLDAEKYRAAFLVELNKILDLMRETWGFAPDLDVKIEPALLVSVDFNIKGFAHRGRKMIVHPKNATKGRKPHLVAREIAQEITAHRNTCADCGEGIDSIRMRAGTYSYYADALEKGYRVARDFDRETRTSKEVILNLNVPPDAVETYLHPHFARMAKKRIEALPPEKRQTVICNKK